MVGRQGHWGMPVGKPIEARERAGASLRNSSPLPLFPRGGASIYSGIGPGQSEESEPHRARLWELRPLIEADAPSTGGQWFPECARPTGEVMVAPQSIPRNAEGVQSEGPGEMS
jgi:hypothetical protein